MECHSLEEVLCLGRNLLGTILSPLIPTISPLVCLYVLSTIFYFPKGYANVNMNAILSFPLGLSMKDVIQESPLYFLNITILL